MTQLNKKTSEMMIAAGDIHACTDITGFGFLGHACEMIEGSDVGMNINSAAVPILPVCRNWWKQVLSPEVFIAIRISVFPKLKRRIPAPRGF